MPYPAYLNYIKSDEKVSAAVANRTTVELDLRTDSLKNRLDTSDLGQAIILWDAPLDTSTVVGSPVYWNDTTKQFELACAQAELSEKYKEYIKSECANCIGLVYKKESATSGHIVLSGVVTLPNIDQLFDATGSGKFYLGGIPGQLTHNILNVCVPLGTIIGKFGECDPSYRVNINPALNDLWSHLHYAFYLRPTYTSDTNVEGWMAVPSDDENAPPDAIYKYNMLEGTLLKSVFPPMPIDACSIEIDWNDLDESVGAKDIPVNCDNCMVRVTPYGIYWIDPNTSPIAPATTITVAIEDATDGASWTPGDIIRIGSYQYTVPANYRNDVIVSMIVNDVNSRGGEIDGWSVSVSGSSLTSIALLKYSYDDRGILTETNNQSKVVRVLPNKRIMREKFIMNKTQYSVGMSCVTSLQPYQNHPFEFVDCNGERSLVGDLYAKFTLHENPLYITTYDGYAMRRFNDNYRQEIVPEVNGIAVAGDTIAIDSNVSPLVIDNKAYHRGLTTITINPLNKAEIAPQIMKLGDALEREYDGIMYVGFPRDRISSILAKFEVPNTFSGTLYLSTMFFSSVAGTFPNISCEYKIIPDCEEPQTLPQFVFMPLNWDTDDTSTSMQVAAYTAYKLNTVKVNVLAGDTIIFKLTRPNSDIAYTGDAGIIRINGILEV